VVSLAIGPDAGRQSSRWRRIAPALLAAGAVACFVAGNVPPVHPRRYLALMLGLVAVVLVIPDAAVVVAFALRPVAQGLLGPAGRLAAESLIRVPARGGVAIAAVATGVALIVQTGGVIQGNADTVREWVDRSIASDLFATSGGPLSASGRTLPMTDEVGARIADTIPGARVVPMRFRHLPWKHQGAETNILLLALDAPRYVAMNAGRRPPLPDLDLYRRLTELGTVLVSENFARLYGVAVGDSGDLPRSSGAVRLRVVGTVVDFSSSRGTLMVDHARYRDAFAADGVDVFAVALPSSSADLNESRRQLFRAPWAAEHAIDVMTRRAPGAHPGDGRPPVWPGLPPGDHRRGRGGARRGHADADLGSPTPPRVAAAPGRGGDEAASVHYSHGRGRHDRGRLRRVDRGTARVVRPPGRPLERDGLPFSRPVPVADGALITALVVVSGLPAGLVPALGAARGEITEGRTRG